MLSDKDFTRLSVAALAAIVGFAGMSELPGRLRFFAGIIGFGGLGVLTFLLATKIIRSTRPTPRYETHTLRLASEHGGMLTPSLLAMECRISLDESNQTLEYLVERGVCYPKANNEGVVQFFFPEFLPPEELT